MIADFIKFKENINIICALDHSSRAGNYFFQSIFDTHLEVLVCPWIQYDYSYLITKFGSTEILPAKEAHTYWTQKSYFGMAYRELDNELIEKIVSFGSDPNVKLDRVIVREVFDSIVLAENTISRKDLLLASRFAFAKGVGRDLSTIKYILVSDAVSLRIEDPITGFSLKIVGAIKNDFESAVFVSLERDPRATIASCRQQYVNQNGNMHGVKLNTFFLRIYNLLRCYFDTDGSVFVYFLIYSAATARRTYEFKLADRPYIIRNEDINISFISTMKKFCDYLNIKFDSVWFNQPYIPTNVGLPWKGKGAYNKLYDRTKYGSLTANQDSGLLNVAGPNEYVTKRWRQQLPINEVGIIEYLFREELDDLHYEYLVFKDNNFSVTRFLLYVFMPYLGEIPKPKWLIDGLKINFIEFVNRLFYIFTLPIFYFLSRAILLKVIFVNRHFKLR